MLIPSNFESIDYSNVKRVSEIIADMALTAQNQKELTDGITEMRAGALKSGNLEKFDTLIKHLQDPKVNNNITEFQIRYDYTFEDYAETEQPYWDVFNQPTQMARNQRLEVLTVSAKDVGYKSFKKTYQLFCKNLRKLNVQIEGNASKNPTQFSEQPLELNAGDWRCDDTGIVRETGSGLIELACRHPIMPVQRLVNIDTGEEKLKIAYCKGKYWREVIVGKKELFDASKIIQLASLGVSVTSKTARILSEYMCDIEAINYEYIEEVESVARLGYIGDGKMFSPYVDSIVFDGDANYKNIFNAITSKGSYEKWLETALMCRKDNITAQIMIASSFASVLIGKLGCLPFFVHLWGVDSGTGKTVALMLSASVWGDPDVGKYIQTFNATQVGHEKTASFLNNIPMCIDELQLSKDSHGHSKFDVYQLSQGVGRTRGNKGGGIDKTPVWSLCVLTTGESPIVSDNSGAGAVNRVIDIECRASDKVIRDGYGVSSTIKQNYGFAGKMFVESLTSEVIEEAKEIYQRNFRELSSGSTTEKQAMSASIILTADELADRFIFRTGNHLTTSQISEFLKSKASVSAGERGYAYMCDWVGLNANKFKHDNENSDIYGIIDGDWVYVNNSVFRKACKDAGFDDRALLSWLKTNNLIQTRGRNMTRGKRINGINVECVVMKLPDIPAEKTMLEELEELI